MAKDNKLIENPKEVEVAEKLVEVAPVEVTEKVEKPVKAEKPVEPKVKVLKFKNVGKGIKIKLIDEKDREKFKWITVKHGEEVSIPRKIALRNRLVEVK